MHLQAALEAERSNLQAKLNDAQSALQLMKPTNQLDTTTPVDKAVRMIDELLKVNIQACCLSGHM